MKRVLIENPQAYEAQRGDIIELHFNLFTLPLLQEFQRKFIISRLESDRHIKVLDTHQTQGVLTITIEIIENPFPLILAIVSVTTILGGWFIWSTFSKAYVLIKEPVTQATLNIGLILGIGIVGLVVTKMFRG